MKWILLFFAISNFLSFFWSVHGIFKKVSDQRVFHYRLLQLNSLALWLLAVKELASLPFSANYILWDTLTIMLQIFCLITFWQQSHIVKENKFSIVFSNDMPIKLVASGLYTRVRHPFYMIYLLCYFSIAMRTQSPLLWILSLSIFLLYYEAAKSEEKKFLSGPLAGDYLRYRKSTWMFVPKWGSHQNHADISPPSLKSTK